VRQVCYEQILWITGILIFAMLEIPDCINAMEFRMANRLWESMYYLPGDDCFQEYSEGNQSALENRLLLSGEICSAFDYGIHILTTLDFSSHRFSSDSTSAFNTIDAESRESFRSTKLKWDWKDADDESRAIAGVTDIDRLILQWNTSNTALTIGRQAIGLSNCFYLMTNDFFQPFAPETIYREYKTGVDAVNFQYYTGALSELDVITVAGYNENEHINWNESALIGRSIFSAASYEWNIMVGKLPWRWMCAGAVQGEIGKLGIRAEFNVNFPETGWKTAFGKNNSEIYIQIAGGIDFRFKNSLHIFMEYLYHENGFAEYNDYLDSLRKTGIFREGYSGQNYLALAISYQWHPLINSHIFGICNMNDESALFSATLSCSLADEADFIIGGYYTAGDEPDLINGFPNIPTQYGSAANSIYAELRFYF